MIGARVVAEKVQWKKLSKGWTALNEFCRGTVGRKIGRKTTRWKHKRASWRWYVGAGREVYGLATLDRFLGVKTVRGAKGFIPRGKKHSTNLQERMTIVWNIKISMKLSPVSMKLTSSTILEFSRVWNSFFKEWNFWKKVHHRLRDRDRETPERERASKLLGTTVHNEPEREREREFYPVGCGPRYRATPWPYS